MFSLSPRALRALLPALLLALLSLSPARAHEGHDHGAEEPAATAPALPGVEATGSEFELAGALRGGTLVLWIDRYRDNAPVTDAEVLVSVDGGQNVKAEARPDGTFALPAGWADQPGARELLFTVTSGDAADLLTGTLTVTEAGDAHHHEHPVPWAWIAGAFLAGLAVAGAGGAALRRRGALAALALLLLVPAQARAHEGHDHAAEEAAPAAADAPRRLADGSLSVPKATQRLLAVRTAPAEAGRAPRTSRLAGRIVSDPGFAGRVQPSQPGRIEPPEGGMPHLGQRVEAGQVLAYVVPAVDTVERGDVQERIAEVEKQLEIARRKAERLERLKGVVAEREVEDARAELAGLRRQREALRPTLARREALRAPVSGIIAAVDALPGQMVDDLDERVLFEIVDPAGLMVEALAFDPALAAQLAAGTAVTDGGAELRLTPVGQGPARRAGAVPLVFRVEQPPAGLSVGTPVTVHAATAASLEGILLPRDAVVRGADGLPTVWEHVGPQRFRPRAVRIEEVGGDRVLVTAGLEPGARVVVAGAGLLNQIR
ncbi:MAG TPA: HlyD family efflux transporter periplasmic adaptor subunit [Azospirillaceae bacterium]|nr:HlyD family efflux transporter periplasmic adaptor subunit [Azospirillaceae bacterium]